MLSYKSKLGRFHLETFCNELKVLEFTISALKKKLKKGVDKYNWNTSTDHIRWNFYNFIWPTQILWSRLCDCHAMKVICYPNEFWSSCFVYSSYQVKEKMTHAWVWLTIVCRGVAPSIRWFWKAAGFLKKQEGLINLLLQRSGNIWKCCSSSLSPVNELTYLRYMAENESIRNW